MLNMTKNMTKEVCEAYWLKFENSASLKTVRETKMQFLRFPGDWGRRKKNRESALLSKILLFKTEQDVRKQFQFNLLEHKI